MTEEEFVSLVGRPSEIDELERANCSQAGQGRHIQCGVCPKCGIPWSIGSHLTTCGFTSYDYYRTLLREDDV